MVLPPPEGLLLRCSGEGEVLRPEGGILGTKPDEPEEPGRLGLRFGEGFIAARSP